MENQVNEDATFYDYVADNFPSTSLRGEMQAMNPVDEEDI